MGSVDAFALLVEELKSDDIVDQVAAAKRINTIALGMGAEKARSQLLPFLRSCVDEYTDEILLAVAEAAGGLVQAIGGGEHVGSLIPLLEALAEKEETIVRAKAVQSLVMIGAQTPANVIQEDFMSLVKRLSAGEFFPSRISAAGLFATVYPSTPAGSRPNLRKQYEQLAKDEMPMVRSAAFAHLPALAAVVEKEVFLGELSPLFNELSVDLQESVREMAVDNMVKMVEKLTPDEAAKYFGAFFDNVSTEKCSAMRVIKAKNFVKLSSAMAPARPMRDQVAAYLQLMSADLEVEVRNAAANNLGAFCAKLDSATVLSQILPVLKELSAEPQDPAGVPVAAMNQQVREHMAENVCLLAPVLGREASINELLPLFKRFLCDELIEIRRKVLRSVAPLVETLGAEAAEQHLLPDVLIWAQDSQWRVRLAVVDTLPAYATHLGMDIFNARLKDVQARALSDSVAHIRERAIANLVDLAELFGDQWMLEQMLPAVVESSKQSGPNSYLGRITSLQAAGSLAAVMPASVVSETLVTQIAVPLSRDRVANVRIAAADALMQCSKKLEKENPSFIKENIRPVLVDLSKDSDTDVKFMAELALHA